MSRRWIVADLHFNHKNILAYENRPFASVEEMNEQIIRRWNNKVSKEDTVYILGDFTLSRRMDVIEQFCRALNGNKVLVMGNHDTRKPQDYIAAGFIQATRKPIMVEDGVVLMHEPFADIRFIAPNYLYFFGHVHGKLCSMDAFPNCKCVSIERLENYEPANFDILLSNMKKLLDKELNI